MEFLRSFLRRHLAGKLVVASPNVGCFLRLCDNVLCSSFIHLLISGHWWFFAKGVDRMLAKKRC